MKYFTREWWASEGDDETVVPAYLAYIDSIKDKMPISLRKFIFEHGLHDAVLNEMKFNEDNNMLLLSFNGWDSKFINKKKYLIKFGCIQNFLFLSDPENLLFDSSGLGDLGYCECEYLLDGLYGYRMLFSSGVELRVEFSEFEFEIKGLES